jgi:purine-binding chemotaxis protein CheW
MDEAQKETVEAKTDQMVVFTIADELFATPVQHIREILKHTETTPVPNTPDYISGIVNVRGKIVPVLELGNILQIGPHQNDESYILLVEMRDNDLVGMIVDSIAKIQFFNASELKNAPDLVKSKVSSEFISGVILPEEQDSNQEVILLVNLEAIITKSIAHEIQSTVSQSKAPEPNQEETQ